MQTVSPPSEVVSGLHFRFDPLGDAGQRHHLQLGWPRNSAVVACGAPPKRHATKCIAAKNLGAPDLPGEANTPELRDALWQGMALVTSYWRSASCPPCTWITHVGARGWVGGRAARELTRRGAGGVSVRLRAAARHARAQAGRRALARRAGARVRARQQAWRALHIGGRSVPGRRAPSHAAHRRMRAQRGACGRSAAQRACAARVRACARVGGARSREARGRDCASRRATRDRARAQAPARAHDASGSSTLCRALGGSVFVRADAATEGFWRASRCSRDRQRRCTSDVRAAAKKHRRPCSDARREGASRCRPVDLARDRGVLLWHRACWSTLWPDRSKATR